MQAVGTKATASPFRHIANRHFARLATCETRDAGRFQSFVDHGVMIETIVAHGTAVGVNRRALRRRETMAPHFPFVHLAEGHKGPGIAVQAKAEIHPDVRAIISKAHPFVIMRPRRKWRPATVAVRV